MFNLDGKNILVVGGASGIGRATADLAAQLGASVILASRTEAKLAKAAEEIGRAATYSVMDMTDEMSVRSWAKALPDIDYLVISASSAVHGPFATSETAPLRGMFDAKFFGPYVTVREVLPKLRDGGAVALFSGVLSRRPGENCAGLGAVNGAVEALTRGLALELGPRLRVNCISPGMVRTEAYASVPDAAREAMYASTGASLPVGRVGEPEEIAGAVIASLTNGYLTGQILDVDGGHMIRQYASR
jgi:NAD(P)-dependent dehydrogenase (short-subunit alcohol dehydrogenase family)